MEAIRIPGAVGRHSNVIRSESLMVVVYFDLTDSNGSLFCPDGGIDGCIRPNNIDRRTTCLDSKQILANRD